MRRNSSVDTLQGHPLDRRRLGEAHLHLRDQALNHGLLWNHLIAQLQIESISLIRRELDVNAELQAIVVSLFLEKASNKTKTKTKKQKKTRVPTDCS